jgi:predicted DNA binding CopG/RHH family protein
VENKPIVITCRVSKTEEEAIDKKAAAAGLTRSQYVRLVCLNANVKISI